MLKVTNSALRQLQTALRKNHAVHRTCFRFRRQGEASIELIIQEPQSTDETFNIDGEPVLAAPKQLVETLSEKILDIDDEGQLVLLPKAA